MCDVRHKKLQKVLLAQQPTLSHNVPHWLRCALKGLWQDCSWWEYLSISEQLERRCPCFLAEKERGARLHVTSSVPQLYVPSTQRGTGAAE